MAFQAHYFLTLLPLSLIITTVLAVVGYLVNKAGIYLPGDIDYSGTKFSDLGSGWDASFAVPVAGALQILAFVGFLEVAVMKDITGGEFPGDFRVSGP